MTWLLTGAIGSELSTYNSRESRFSQTIQSLSKVRKLHPLEPIIYTDGGNGLSQGERERLNQACSNLTIMDLGPSEPFQVLRSRIRELKLSEYLEKGPGLGVYKSLLETLSYREFGKVFFAGDHDERIIKLSARYKIMKPYKLHSIEATQNMKFHIKAPQKSYLNLEDEAFRHFTRTVMWSVSHPLQEPLFAVFDRIYDTLSFGLESRSPIDLEHAFLHSIEAFPRQERNFCWVYGRVATDGLLVII